jgi:hypothetical protein
MELGPDTIGCGAGQRSLGFFGVAGVTPAQDAASRRSESTTFRDMSALYANRYRMQAGVNISQQRVGFVVTRYATIPSDHDRFTLPAPGTTAATSLLGHDHEPTKKHRRSRWSSRHSLR